MHNSERQCRVDLAQIDFDVPPQPAQLELLSDETGIHPGSVVERKFARPFDCAVEMVVSATVVEWDTEDFEMGG